LYEKERKNDAQQTEENREALHYNRYYTRTQEEEEEEATADKNRNITESINNDDYSSS